MTLATDSAKQSWLKILKAFIRDKSDLKTAGLAKVLSITLVRPFCWQKAATAGMSGISSRGLLIVSM